MAFDTIKYHDANNLVRIGHFPERVEIIAGGSIVAVFRGRRNFTRDLDYTNDKVFVAGEFTEEATISRTMTEPVEFDSDNSVWYFAFDDSLSPFMSVDASGNAAITGELYEIDQKAIAEEEGNPFDGYVPIDADTEDWRAANFREGQTFRTQSTYDQAIQVLHSVGDGENAVRYNHAQGHLQVIIGGDSVLFVATQYIDSTNQPYTNGAIYTSGTITESATISRAMGATIEFDLDNQVYYFAYSGTLTPFMSVDASGNIAITGTKTTGAQTETGDIAETGLNWLLAVEADGDWRAVSFSEAAALAVTDFYSVDAETIQFDDETYQYYEVMDIADAGGGYCRAKLEPLRRPIDD